MTRHRGGRAGAALLLGTTVLGLGAVPVTGAGFTDRATATGGSFSSAVMTAPNVPTADQVRGPGSTRVSWTAPRMGGHGGAPSAYDVYRYPAATGGTGVLACTVDVGTTGDVGRALACEDTSRTGGTHHYAVRARQGQAWRAESGRVAITPDLDGPAVGLTDPVDGYRGSGFFLRLGLVFSCGGSPACGSAADPAGIVAVRWSLAFRPAGSTAVRCWSPGGYGGTVAPSTCGEHDAVVEAGRGGVGWRLPGTSDGPFRDRGTYTLRVTGVDGFANTSTVQSVVTLT